MAKTSGLVLYTLSACWMEGGCIAHQLALHIVAPGQREHRIVPALLQDAELALLEGAHPVAWVQHPHLAQVVGVLLPEGAELVPAIQNALPMSTVAGH